MAVDQFVKFLAVVSVGSIAIISVSMLIEYFRGDWNE